MSPPLLSDKLPDLTRFTHHLADDYQSGRLHDWDTFKQHTTAFYTPEMMGKIEMIVPGWVQMAAYAKGQTLVHVTSVLVALYVLPEYLAASREQQIIMEWMVMFHDVAKQAFPGKHDYTHAFRSAAITGRALAALGFPKTTAYAGDIESWYHLTATAIIYDPQLAEDKQDNNKLPDILQGLERMYGPDSPAALIIKGVLLHLSIDSDPSYPTVAPLTTNELGRYLDANLHPLLKMMMLVDNDSWELFNPTNKQHQRDQTLKAFDEIGTLISI